MFYNITRFDWKIYFQQQIVDCRVSFSRFNYGGTEPLEKFEEDTLKPQLGIGLHSLNVIYRLIDISTNENSCIFMRQKSDC